MLKNLYDWTIAQAEKPYALWVLFCVAFVESSVFPIPPDVLMIPMILARPSKAFVIALICLVGSVFGGILGYWIFFAIHNLTLATIYIIFIDFAFILQALHYRTFFRETKHVTVCVQ